VYQITFISVPNTTALGTIIQPSISSIVFNDILPQNFKYFRDNYIDQFQSVVLLDKINHLLLLYRGNDLSYIYIMHFTNSDMKWH
jgi:hypothetical protein